MRISEQFSYRSGSMSRPQAKIQSEQTLNLTTVSFSWGEVDLSEKILENVRFYIDSFQNGSEITNPFGYLESLSGLENAIRLGLCLSNDVIFRLINKTTIAGGAEGVVLVRRGRELAIGQIGQPQVLLIRGQRIIPLSVSVDVLPLYLEKGLSLPNRLLGLTKDCHPSILSFQTQPGDELLLLAHSFLPSALFSYSKNPYAKNLQELYQQIARETPQNSFWLSRIALD